MGATLLPRRSWAEAGIASAPSMTAIFGPLKDSLLRTSAWTPFAGANDRAKWESLPADVRAAVVQRADANNNTNWPAMLATDELEFARTGNRTHTEGLSFGRRAKLGALVLGECVAGKGAYVDQIANGIWMICEETFWGIPAHVGLQKAGVGLADAAEPVIDLFAAETAAMLAWTVYLLHAKLDAVSPMLVKRVAAEMERRIFVPYATRNDFSWMGLDGKGHSLNNWNPWINSNVLVSALLLDEGERRQQIVTKVCRSLDQYIVQYPSDGGCEEGPGYWARAAASYFDCAELLVSAHGGKGDAILRSPLLRAMGQWIADVHIAGNNYVNFGDAHVHASPEPEELFRFGRATGNDTLAAFGAYLFASSKDVRLASTQSLPRALAQLWVVDDLRAAPKHDALSRDAWYPKLGMMAARETEGSAAGMYVAMLAASNGRSHAHNDSGSFLVYTDGEPVFVDAGSGTYTAQTFSKDRYKIWTMQSQFHNLPEIGGVGEHEGAYAASQLTYSKTESRSSLQVNLATAYPPEAGVTRWMRTVALDREKHAVEVQEEFTLARAEDVALHYLVAVEPKIAAGSVQIGHAVLVFDVEQLAAKSERIELTDLSLKHTWGDALWRVTLHTPQPVSRGSWRVEIRKG